MSKLPPNPNRRPSARYARRQRQLAAQRERQSLIVRLRALQGRARILVWGGILVVVLGVIAATGGTAYAINQENHDAFCASCHTQPESTYYQQSQAQNAATLSAFHTGKSVNCIDCHSGGGPFGRIEGITQGAQDLLSYYSGNYHNPAITTSKLGDDSCAKCHDTIARSAGINNHFHQFLSQWQAVDSNAAHCVDCHTGHGAGDTTQQYLVVASVEQVCQACHNVLRRGG
ncbi:MAG: NapC/NirT family cytochrome c [Anaerolineae bacterium]